MPPFELMMVRLSGYSAVTDAQAQQMLSWYGLNAGTLTAGDKLDFISCHASI